MLFSRTLFAMVGLSPLLLGSAASASLRRATPAPKSLEIDNNFETEMNSDPVAATQRIGVYNLLDWSMALATLGVDGQVVTGIVPHTPNNVAAFTARSELTNGPAMISANYPTSQVTSFSVKSMYYGCEVATVVTSAAVISSCNITATAYNKANDQLAQQTFNFVYTGGLTQQMTMGTFNSGFQNVYKVLFNVSSSATTVAVMDDVITDINE